MRNYVSELLVIVDGIDIEWMRTDCYECFWCMDELHA